LHPQAVSKAVEHLVARVFEDLLGPEQLVPAISGHGLVGLDAAEPAFL
jgi:hypothetical protein